MSLDNPRCETGTIPSMGVELEAQFNIELMAVSLANGEFYRFGRSEIIGTLKPELLPGRERLILSQVKPKLSGVPQESPEFYTGYCFLPNGRYSSGVMLNSPDEVMEFVSNQAPYQHRVLVCDALDFAVMEVAGGVMVFPTMEEIEAQRQSGEIGGMKMT
jgi:hypothetical protein